VSSPAITHSSVDKIFALEDALGKLPQVELEVRHHFAPGVYVREMFLPAGVCATGAIHNTEHMSICLNGRMKMVSATAPDRIIEAGDIIVSPPGTKRAVYVLEDAVLLTIHATEERDIAKLEAMLVHNDRRLLEHERRELLEGEE